MVEEDEAVPFKELSLRLVLCLNFSCVPDFHGWLSIFVVSIEIVGRDLEEFDDVDV